MLSSFSFRSSVAAASVTLFATALRCAAVENPLFAVDFSSPPHTLGMRPSTGTTTAPSNGVSSVVFGQPTVAASYGSLTQQPLELRGGGSFTNYSQIQFNLGQQDDFVTFEMDFCYLASAAYRSGDGLRILFDTPQVRSVDFSTAGDVYVAVPSLGIRRVGRFDFDRTNNVRILINLRRQTWRLSLNGTLLDESSFNTGSLQAVRINLSSAAVQNPAAALDNIVINGYSGGPSVVEGPRSQSVAATDAATFAVIASGDSMNPDDYLKYQWLFNGQPIPGATADKLVINGVKQANAGSYSVLVSNRFSSSTSSPATLTVTPPVARLQNISTRLNVQDGERALIGGFIVRGASPKRVIIRALGPSLGFNGMPLEGRLADPQLTLFNAKGEVIAVNDDWRDTQESEIAGSTIPPGHEKEAAIVANLQPGSYTAIVQGISGAAGVGLVEVYDIDTQAATKLANVSTRGEVQTGQNVMIGGVILGGGESGTVLVRAIGPSLRSGTTVLPNTLANPQLELRDPNGQLVAQNDDWKDSVRRADIEASGAPPKDDREAAIIAKLPAGSYTAILSGVNDTSGLAVVEVYHLGQ